MRKGGAPAGLRENRRHLPATEVIRPETFREAQRNPDAYRNLWVQVTGYNAYCVTLDKEMRDKIIARESHTL